MDRLLRIIIKYAPIYKAEDLNNEITLNFDLGIHGDDAIEIFNEIYEEFDVDFSEFTFGKYFLEEGEDSLFASILFFLMRREQFDPKIPLKISSLYLGVEKKKLTDSDIQLDNSQVLKMDSTQSKNII